MPERELERNNRGVLVRRREPPAAWSRADRFRERLDRSKDRLRDAVDLVKVSARDMTPAARIESNPVAWVVGGLVLGLAFGWMTASRYRRHPFDY
jgi:hypothetical protein